MCVSVCVNERVCMWVRERNSVCVCVRDSEKERGTGEREMV